MGEGMCIACSTRSGMTEGPGMESCSRPWASDAMAALPVKVQLAGRAVAHFCALIQIDELEAEGLPRMVRADRNDTETG